MTITLRQPPPGQDAIEVQVTRPGRQKTPFDRGHGYRPNGDLILRGTAWRGANAGERFGATTFGPQVHALRVDAAGLSQDRLLVGLRTTLDLPAGTKVDERLAPGTDLIDPRTRRFPVTATGQQGGTPFGARPSIARDGGTVLRFAALRESEGSAPYADVTLPWPVGPG